MNEKLITTYIAAWMWHLITVIFFATTIILIATHSFLFIIITISIMVVSEAMAWKRKWQVFENGS